MCNCVSVDFGDYSNQTVLTYPSWFKSEKKSAGIDNCILCEIVTLWNSGIQTIESCCGHNKVDGYIAVSKEYINQMLTMGYKQYNDRPELFYPKY